MNAPQPTPTSLLTPAERVRAECLALSRPALRRCAPAVLGLLVVTAGASYSTTSLRLLLLWVAIALCGTVIVGFVSGWRDTLETGQAVQTHHREIICASAIAGMSFGSAAWLLLPETLGSVSGTVTLAIISLAASMAIGLQLIPGAALAVFIGALAPLVARMAYVHSTVAIGTALVAVVASAALVMLMKEAASNQVKLVRNRLENEMLGRRLVRATQLARTADEELNRLQNSLAETQARDEITGAYNRRQLNRHLADTWTQANNGFDPFSLALIEVDRYDQVIEAHGSDIGDELLRQVGKIIGSNLRTDDVLARLSGSQFAVVLQNTLIEGSLIALERIRRGLAASPIDAGEPLVVRASIGVVTFSKETLPREMLLRADEALGAARSHGGNRITVNEAELRDIVAMV
jgi:diguanylate cyclase (GGDEF)-like protein